MNFERYCGLASAAMIVLILALIIWSGLGGPVWQAAWEMKPSDALGVIVAVVGWVVTILVGAIAYLAALKQIRLAQNQLMLQQQQIADTQQQLRKSNYLRLGAEFQHMAFNIDRLLTAQAYLLHFAGQFPNDGNLDGWARQMIFSHRDATNFISQSAVQAPFGYGSRILSVMTRMEKLGERIDATSPGIMPQPGILSHYDPLVKEAIIGVRSIAAQISEEIPKRQGQLMALERERDGYADGSE